MPRVASPFGYQDPSAQIGASLARALFGDPEMAAKHQQQQAQADQLRAAAEANRAHAGLYTSQTAGQDGQNAARLGLPELLARMAAQPGQDPNEAFRTAMPAVVAALAQSQGDKVDTGETIGSLASFLGGDEMARRGMVAQGHSPTADFAITPERADQIAAADAMAKLKQALGVAEVNNASDIPVANIQAASAANVAGINNASDIPVAQIQAASRAAGRTAKASTPKAPRAVSGAAGKALDVEFDAQFANRGWDKKLAAVKAKNMLRNRAYANFQKSGNPVDAVGSALSSIRLEKRGPAPKVLRFDAKGNRIK